PPVVPSVPSSHGERDGDEEGDRPSSPDSLTSSILFLPVPKKKSKKSRAAAVTIPKHQPPPPSFLSTSDEDESKCSLELPGSRTPSTSKLSIMSPMTRKEKPPPPAERIFRSKFRGE